jgi:hippurate hydrolase
MLRFVVIFFIVGTSPAFAQSIKQELIASIKIKVDAQYPSLETLYKHLHSHPELSLAEKETAARIAEELKAAKCEVTTGVGGHGVVGVMKNGSGPVIMLRADMDALPIAEVTKLPYASQVRTKDRRGGDVGVMHACGHDVNMTSLVGTARLMNDLRDQWQGTIVFVGQPAEEIGAGARLMIADGLFHRFPRPEKCFALHCDARFPHGHINYRSGQMQANVDTVDIVVLGKGGHGAAPQVSIDPVVIAARIVIDLQTIVSRELDPLDAAVVTVGSIHGGTKHNIIPGEVRLQLTVRTTNDKARRHVLDGIKRIATAAATAARAPEPKVLVDEDQFTPALVNDPELTTATMAVLREVIGADHVHERPMSLGGEDFSRYVLAGVPGCYYFLGTAPPEKVEAAKNGGPPLALTHTDSYYPVPEPTIKTGVLTMTATLLNSLKK